mmetsp:Transcript_1286/g.5225  ORF Transcript_1286/g.5225 Transcript_1286/m.5225 type:complete len:202 (-) Transcript_1286:681-1286(-)
MGAPPPLPRGTSFLSSLNIAPSYSPMSLPAWLENERLASLSLAALVWIRCCPSPPAALVRREPAPAILSSAVATNPRTRCLFSSRSRLRSPHALPGRNPLNFTCTPGEGSSESFELHLVLGLVEVGVGAGVHVPERAQELALLLRAGGPQPQVDLLVALVVQQLAVVVPLPAHVLEELLLGRSAFLLVGKVAEVLVHRLVR